MKLTILLLTAFAFPASADTSEGKKEHHRQMLTNPSGGTRALRLLEKHIPTESRIVGGSEAEVGEYPFFVEWSGCGASLIHPDIILSAAHCYGNSASTVRVGSSRKGFFGVSDEERGEKRTIMQKVKHPQYIDSTIDYDYMVMKLDNPVDIKPIGLNDDGQSPSDGEVLTVIGYGTLSEGGSTPNSLQEVNVNYIPTADCNDDYDGEINGNTMMCAGVGGGKDSCQGDSGGPIFEFRNGEPVQVGIVSWGFGCARPEYPGVYSRVSGELDWIQQKICQLTDVEPKPAYCAIIDDGEGGGDTGVEGKVSVRIDITYDQYPVENSWLLRRGQTIIASQQVGTQLTQGLVEERINVNPGTHDFEFRDTFGDGICCSFGSGGFDIYAELPTGDVLLASGDGQFGSVVSTQFVVPSADDDTFVTAAPTTDAPVVIPAPTSAPVQTTSPVPAPVDSPSVCEDKDGTFLVDDVTGTRNCNWLEQNLVNFGYLCKFVEIASKCQATCSACDYFKPRES